MTEAEVRDRIAAQFEAARATPGRAFDPDRFLAHLTEPPAAKGRGVRDTFGGRRRLVRFMQTVQLEHAICFNSEEWERGLSLDDFAALVSRKRGSPSQALRLAQRRVTEARMRLWADPAKFAVLLAPLLIGVALPVSLPVRALIFLAWAAIPLAVARLTGSDYRYSLELAERITASGERE